MDSTTASTSNTTVVLVPEAPFRSSEGDDASVDRPHLSSIPTEMPDLIGKEPVCLEGTLQMRKGRWSGHSSLLWKKRHVFLSLTDGGSISVYREPPEPTSAAAAAAAYASSSSNNNALQSMYSKLHRSISVTSLPQNKAVEEAKPLLDLFIPSRLPWIVKDVENTQSTFVVEIPTGAPLQSLEFISSAAEQEERSSNDKDEENENDDSLSFAEPTLLVRESEDPNQLSFSEGAFLGDNGSETLASEEESTTQGTYERTMLQEQSTNVLQETLPAHVGVITEAGLPSCSATSTDAVAPILSTPQLYSEMKRARRHGKNMRIYFRCTRGSGEKALWLRALAKINRLSQEMRRKKSLLVSLTSPLNMSGRESSRARLRSASNANFARDARALDQEEYGTDHAANADVTDVNLEVSTHVEEIARGILLDQRSEDKEYKVLPAYAYPHRWMTKREMQDEMVQPSAHFHDLRQRSFDGATPKEIGTLRVEVLQCLGLPKLERTSEIDAVAYLVCGSHAFTTDIVPNRANPMWLRNTRRACIFPLFHAYARLYVGIFGDDKNSSKDDFAGRVVLDVARLRPASTYDVTLPLRLSAHAYSRKRRGAVRLRFTLNWENEGDALWSYIPKKIPRIPLPQHSKPNMDVTVACADAKAFRNVAITVHGSHLPGRFTFPKVRAVIREMNFTRKFIFERMRQEIRETRQWANPTVSAFVFLAWMHCIYANAFALVPAYVVLFFLLQMIRTYVIYGVDGPSQRGFVPPSWEELFMAMLQRRWRRPTKGTEERENGTSPPPRTRPAIEPLDLGLRPSSTGRRRAMTGDSILSGDDASLRLEESHQNVDYKVSTHVPRGKWLFRALGLMSNKKNELIDVDENHLEFPFANGSDYPKFRVKECMANRRGDKGRVELSQNGEGDSFRVMADKNGEIRLIRRLDVDLLELMRKDSSGTRDYDEEEGEFAPRHALAASGLAAVSKVQRTVTGIGSATGLKQHVVAPIRTGIHQGIDQVSRGIDQVSSGVTHLIERPHAMRRVDSTDSDMTGLNSVYSGLNETSMTTIRTVPSTSELNEDLFGPSSAAAAGATAKWTDQNIELEGPSTGRKLTDDLADINDKMHDMTWHLFDDNCYVLQENALYFGDGRKSVKRTHQDVPKKLDKLLQVGQYSNTNPFVSRLGLYVEPIIESVLSFLCLFRAGHNAVTWQDPILSFWLSFLAALLALILFIFPWRIFLFVLGIFLVGPQNWIIRILRERGHLPQPKPPQRPSNDKPEFDLSNQPILHGPKRVDGMVPKPPPDVDTREIQRVVVPYSPLMYQRFFDWPPEPQYAQVRPEDPRRVTKPDFFRASSSDTGSVDGQSTRSRRRLSLGLRRRAGHFMRRRPSLQNVTRQQPSSPLDDNVQEQDRRLSMRRQSSHEDVLRPLPSAPLGGVRQGQGRRRRRATTSDAPTPSRSLTFSSKKGN